MKYDFDEIIDRKKSNSLKWNKELYSNIFDPDLNLTPFWIADMDFKVSEAIQKKIRTLLEHGIFGYTSFDNEYYNSVISWYEEVHNWKISKENIIYTPGLVPALSYLIEAFSQKHDSIMILTPVYYPFKEVIMRANRTLVESSLLKDKNNYYTMNFEEIENLIIKTDVKILLFCSPHNPVGRVWTRSELENLVDICLRNNVIIIADEIHSDLIFGKNKHIPLLSLNREVKENCIVCTSPTKTFNLAGLCISNIIIENPIFREKYKNILEKYGIIFPNVFSIECLKSAYQDSFDWYYEVLEYINKNIEFTELFIKTHLHNINFQKPEGTYLGWLDFTYYNFSIEDFKDTFEKEIGLAVDYGHWFGSEGLGFIRLNIACPKKILEEALIKIRTYFSKL